jgi:hypothetical protein
MNGVEILTAEEVVTETTTNWWLAGIVWLVIVVIAGIIGFFCSDYYERYQGAVVGYCLIGVLVGMIPFILIGAFTTKPVTYETHYKVTIDSSVSMTEFMDKYDIIDQEGKIYTVREREN